MSAYVSPPSFTNNVGQLISSADLEIARNNVALAEALTYRPVNGLNSSGNVNAYTPHYYPIGLNSFLLWAGAVTYRSGMTSLVVTGTASGYGAGALLKVSFDGVFKFNISPAANFSASQALSGYTDGQVINVTINATWTSGLSIGSEKFVITDLYTTPITFASSWPGVPTFGSSFPAASLTQLFDAADWIFNRVNATPNPAALVSLYQLGPFKDPAVEAAHGLYPLYYGGVLVANSNSILRVTVLVTNQSSPGLRMDTYINGVLADSSANIPIGTNYITRPIAFSGLSIGDVAEVSIFGVVTSAGPSATWLQSRWSFYAVRSEPAATNVYTTPATPPAPEVLTSATALAAYLNNLASILTACKARIDAAPNLWQRGRALRRFYSKDNAYNDLAPKRGRPKFDRYGDRLLVRGKGVSIAYGAITIPTNDRGLNFDEYSFGQTQQIIDGDKLQTKTVYLDSFAGLSVGMTYYLLGDVQHAEEFLI